ncbi:MjaI family restriction endonuclease [uncultured Mucilaginibacter sp.]|uniref:MjaI family restriction endonuclease n=1 Tax=uncultured Mucilaginibacter sp. TaxID=797541 RepID=UPI002608A8F3|nr:MjaI family restriction endonuclease [uncultured Mucilaginibacter sp.]
MPIKRYSKEFGKKEKVLNYATQTYQLSRPNKVGAVMALIRECQPKNFEDWQQWYFENAHTDGKNSSKVSPQSLEELGERLYVKIKEIVIPEWTEAFNQLTLQDCIDYIVNLTINRTYDGFIREKSVVHDNLIKKFPQVKFEESDPVLDHAGDIDYLGWVGDKAFGLQIKPVTTRANFGNYSASERMQNSFKNFMKQYGGNVFIVISLDDKIKNEEVEAQIAAEVERLSTK